MVAATAAIGTKISHPGNAASVPMTKVLQQWQKILRSKFGGEV
jgi:hypothetical protein